MQVWHRTGRGSSHGPVLVLDDPAHSHSLAPQSVQIELQKLSASKTELYCTINCNKGLKVQDLFLVCILRFGSHLFVSGRTPFPSAHARKGTSAGARERRERVSPFMAPARQIAGASSSTRGAPSTPPPSAVALRALLLAQPLGATISDHLDRVLSSKSTLLIHSQ